MSHSKLRQAVPAFSRLQERLSEDRSFQIYTLIIPFMAVAVLTIFTSFETATRLFGTAQPLEHNGPPIDQYGVWLSIGSKQGNVVVSTIDGKSLSWPLSGPSAGDSKRMTEFLRGIGKELVEKSVIKGQLEGNDSIVALSVDQRLNFHHIRPLLYALAGAGFTKYGFETRVIR